MELQIKTPEDIKKLLENRTNYLEEMTQKMIHAEVGLIELNLSLKFLDKGHIKRAHNDTEEFKKELWNQSQKLSQKNKTEAIQEYKKLINFI